MSQIHPTADVHPKARIGKDVVIWQHVIVREKAAIRDGAELAANAWVDAGAYIGKGSHLMLGAGVGAGSQIMDGVLLAPYALVLNSRRVRATDREDGNEVEIKPSRVFSGATIGARATVQAGLQVGRFAFVQAGAVVTHDVPPYAIVRGIPATVVGWACRCGRQLDISLGRMATCHGRYALGGEGVWEVP